MSFHILCEGEPCPLQHVPANLAHFSVPGATTRYADTGKGYLFFQEIPGSSFSISYGRYYIGRPFHIDIKKEEPMLELHLAFKSRLEYKAVGLGEVAFRENQFALRYLPFLDRSADLCGGKAYETVSIRFTAAYLDTLLDTFPALRSFADLVARQQPANYTDNYPYATREMLRTLHNIFSCSFSGDLRRRYLNAQVESYILQALYVLTGSYHPYTHVLSSEEADKIRQVAGLIGEEPGHSWALESLAHAFNLDNTVLRRGFKEIYGTTVFDYVIDARMKKARQLLSDTDKTEAEIAFLAGYANTQSFTADFTKTFGHLPAREHRPEAQS